MGDTPFHKTSPVTVNDSTPISATRFDGCVPRVAQAERVKSNNIITKRFIRTFYWSFNISCTTLFLRSRSSPFGVSVSMRS